MTTAAPDRIWSGIELPRILAGALAAVCAAVAGSFLGVAGTVIGAAVASIIGSVGTEIYARSIKKGTEKLQTLAPAFIKAPAAVGTPPVEAAAEEDSPSETVAEPATPQIRWKRVALAAGLLFVLAMGALTAVELLAGKSVASMVGSDSSGGTTLSSVTGGDSQQDAPAPAPVVSVTPTDATTPTPAPSVSSEPSATPSSSPSDTGTPTTSTPQQTPGDSTTGGTGTPQTRAATRARPDRGVTVQSADVLAEAFGRLPDLVHEAVHGLTPEQLREAPAKGANTIGWLVWHLTRVQDSHVAELLGEGEEQLYVTGDWAGRFGKEADPSDTGYGYSAAEVEAVAPESWEALDGYFRAVHERTAGYVQGLTADDLDRVVDENWDPPVTLGVRLISVYDDCAQHVGQAAYVRGLIDG